MRRLTKQNQQGFTLIELLVVIGILAIILAITIIALNPVKHFKDARNADRQSDVTAILDAVYEYEAANRGVLPPSITNLGSTAVYLGAPTATTTATSTSFTGPSTLTYTVPSGNTINSGSVIVNSCSIAGDNGSFPVTSGTTTTIVVTDTSGAAGATGCVISPTLNVCTDLVSTYIAALPTDPTAATGTACTPPYNTGYTIAMNANNRLTVAAPSAENGATISVTR